MGAGASAEEQAEHDLQVLAMKKKMETLEAALAQKSKDLESHKKVVSAQKKVNNSLRKEVTSQGGDSKADLFKKESGGAVGMAGLGLGGGLKPQDLSNWGDDNASSGGGGGGGGLADWGASDSVLGGGVGNNATMALLQSAKSWSLPPSMSAAEVSRAKTAEEIANEIQATREAQRILAERETKAKLKRETKAKMEAGLTAINAFKVHTGERMLSSKSRLHSRIQRRKTLRALKQSGAVADDGPPPPLPERPKVESSKVLDLTFQEKTLGIHFEEMTNEPPYSLFVWSVVAGWEGQRNGVCADDILTQINDQKLDNMDFDMVMDMLLSAPRPLRLVLRRDNFEGWTKAEDLPPPPLPTRKKDKAASSSDGGGGDQPPDVPPKVPPKKKKKKQKKSKKVNEGRAPAALPSPTATPG